MSSKAVLWKVVIQNPLENPGKSSQSNDNNRDTNGSSNLGQMTRLSDSLQKLRTYWILNFAIPADHEVKLKESKKRSLYLDFGRELIKLWNMKVTVIPIVVSALVTVTKAFEQGQKDLEISVETIQTTALLTSVRILSRALKIWGDLLSLKLPWKTIS